MFTARRGGALCQLFQSAVDWNTGAGNQKINQWRTIQQNEKRTIERRQEYATDPLVVIGPADGVVLAPRIEHLQRRPLAIGHVLNLRLE